MALITNPHILALAEEGETAWEGSQEGTVLFQRACTCRADGHPGLSFPKGEPARFHGTCGGSGYLIRPVTP